MDIRDVVDELRHQFAVRPDLETLRAVRERLDDPAFASAIREYHGRQHNDPNLRIEFENRLRSLLRTVQDHNSDVDYEAAQVGAIGIGGGVGLVGGSIVAAATAAFPAVVLIPVMGGALMAVTAFFGGKVLNRERTSFVHISANLEKIVQELEEARRNEDA